VTNTASARLLLVRHGQIAANVDKVWHGSTDSALTTRGEAQADAVADYVARGFGPAAVYASPLMRTTRTASAIARSTGLQVSPDADLIEWGIGELEGTSYVRLYSDGFFDRMRADADWAPPGGESRAEVTGRMISAFERIAEAHRGSEVVIVSHGAAMALALSTLLDGHSEQWQRYHTANCGLSEFVLEPEPKLLRFDETAHLP
jgi:broad specificity phosphatase PhoE